MTRSTHARRPLRPAIAVLSLAMLAAGCGGLTFFTDDCFGPYCTVGCTTDADCPVPSRCVLSRCSTDASFDGGIVGPDGARPDGGSLPDGALEEQPLSDPGPGDWLAGDAPADHDWGDNVIVGADGLTCQDPDRDGHCPCCSAGPECSNVANSEYDATIYPGAVEVCDVKDNNCDGQVDEGVLNACGNCLPYPLCNTDDPWVTPGPSAVLCGPSLPACVLPATCVDGACTVDHGVLPPPDPDDGTILEDGDVPPDGRGGITLQTGNVSTDFAWPASQQEGSISRIDTVAGREVGRFTTVLLRNGDPYRDYVADFGPDSQCQQPSRSTVDEFGNAYIANRAISGYAGTCNGGYGGTMNDNGSVTKIGYYNATLCDNTLNPGLTGCQCADRNGNHRIELSQDYDTPPDGIQLPTCTGTGGTLHCDSAPTCTTDAECAAITLTPCSIGAPCATQCIGGRCTYCLEDADCPSGKYCVRQLYPSQPRGKCSDARPSVAPCSGADCSTLGCTRTSDCGGGSFCVLNQARKTNNSLPLHVCSTQPQQPEFLGKDDECVLWTRRIPGTDSNISTAVTHDNLASNPRAMALDRDAYIWVGEYGNSGAFKLSPTGDFVCPFAAGCCPDGKSCAGGANLIAINHPCPRTAHRVSDGAVVANPADPTTGCSSQRCYFTLDSTCRIALGLSPYGAVVDSGKLHPNGFGYLWFTNTNGNLQRVDTETGLLSAVFDTRGAYGITIDQYDRVWIADSGEGGSNSVPTVNRFDPGNAAFVPTSSSCAACWASFTAQGASGAPWAGTTSNWRGRGITTELRPDGTARIWAVFNTDDWWAPPNYLLAFDSESGAELTAHRLRLDNVTIDSASTATGCVAPDGVGVGYGGKIWVVNRDTSSLCAYDPATGYDAALHPILAVKMGPSPYTYSDFTGNLYRSFTKPQGKYRVLVDGCPTDYKVSDWGVVTWEADTPGLSKVEVRFRIGNTIGEAQNPGALQDGPVTQPPDSSYDLPNLDGEWLEIEFNLVAEQSGVIPAPKPTLYRVDVTRSCVYAPNG